MVLVLNAQRGRPSSISLDLQISWEPNHVITYEMCLSRDHIAISTQFNKGYGESFGHIYMYMRLARIATQSKTSSHLRPSKFKQVLDQEFDNGYLLAEC
ncbi:hypothetical protein MANES_11G068412v8 [Manihot esculenta]|uniref:Uncharacterized protein n=1 Tax=Manihot esculenta TaxID=3983 RepID=A0ACB7GW63_MANES|nr:hypothetical protein MANES_11G068412v8 [Manihot esculenta]